MLKLFIDTSSSQILHLSLESEEGKKESSIDATENRSQSLLPALEEFLNKEGKQLSDLTEVTIHTGPGSFTGLRVGAAIARVLSGVLNIPINGLPPGTLPEITYGEDKWNLQKSTTPHSEK